MNSRPKSNETEHDILKLQEEFLKTKQQPSTRIVKSSKPSDLFQNESETSESTEPKLTLIGTIVERHNSGNVSNEVGLQNVPRFSSGFPQAKRRQKITEGKSGSIFSQQNKKLKESKTAIDESRKNFPTRSYIVAGENRDEIHNENIQKLSEMPEHEIIEEQQKLLSTLDPAIIKFLKSKRKPPNDDMDSKMESELNVIPKEPVMDLNEIETPNEILSQSKADNWLHFDTVETDKLQWMKSIDIPDIPPNTPYEARFDFKGWVLPYVDKEISEENRALYHHGEESGRPGYTLKELFQLCRSNVQQQRILALNTLANILSLNWTGCYDHILDIPIEQLFFIVRTSLDENTVAVLNACVHTLYRLFCSQIDEICLDRLLGFGFNFAQVQPMLAAVQQVNNHTNQDDKEINDQQLVEIDLIRCLIRTDILIRIRYIINTVQPPTETVMHCLELLIRLMRDSDEIAGQLFECDDLISSVCKHFLPVIYKLETKTNSCYGVPVSLAIKLLRIAASRNKHFAKELIDKCNVMSSICSYISNDIGYNTNGIQIQIESLHLFAIFIHYDLATEYLYELNPFLMQILDYHYKNTNINMNSSQTVQHHFSALLHVIRNAVKVNFNFVTNYIPFLIKCLEKFTKQASALTDFHCDKLQILTAILTTLATIRDCTESTALYPDNELISSLLSSKSFSVLTNNLISSSNLFCKYIAHKTAANFSSVEASVWSTSEHIVPCLQTKSSIPFTLAFAQFLTTINNNNLIVSFLQHPNIYAYLQELNKSELYFQSNWFTKLESQFIMNVLKCIVKVQSFFDEQTIRTFYQLTVKCLCVFHVEQKLDIAFVFKNILFNQKFFSNEILIAQLNLCKDQEEGKNYLNEVCQCYCQILGLHKNNLTFSETLTLNINIGNIIPNDWIFSPILSLYSRQQEKQDETDIILTTHTLRWIIFYEKHFGDLISNRIDPTDRYCRLCCVFLCNNTLFLETEVQELLTKCFLFLITYENLSRINFDKSIQGLTNFQDFYVQLLEHYQGVSYGNVIFANYILLPLGQRYNSKWRRVFWSEYQGVAQAIILNEEQCLLNVKEYLEPAETDLSILKCYRKALVTGALNRSPLLKKVANFHVEHYVKE